MKRILFCAICCLGLGSFSCQSGKPTTAASTETAVDINPNLLPMFGNLAREGAAEESDRKFLEYADQNFGSRQEGSQFFSTRAWEYLTEGQADTAMYRFNLAWLLDNTNPQVFWGFGATSAMQGNLEAAITHLGHALTLDAENPVLMVDLASVHQGRHEKLAASQEEGQQKKKKKRKGVNDLAEADKLLQKALAIDSTSAYAHYRLSYNNYLQEDFAQAWEHLHMSRQYDLSYLDFTYLSQLMLKMDDPKGVFRGEQLLEGTEPQQEGAKKEGTEQK